MRAKYAAQIRAGIREADEDVALVLDPAQSLNIIRTEYPVRRAPKSLYDGLTLRQAAYQRRVWELHPKTFGFDISNYYGPPNITIRSFTIQRIVKK